MADRIAVSLPEGDNEYQRLQAADAQATAARLGLAIDVADEASAEMAGLSSQVPFLGIDGVPSVGQKLVANGQLAATIVMPSNTGPALEALARWLRSGTLPPLSVRVPVASFPGEAELRARAASRGGPQTRPA